MAQTAETATDFQGDKLYQQRARLALPILVRQAKARKPIVYEDMAAELGMPNPRNLNYPLGSIGDALNALSRDWNTEIPHIQAMVVNKGGGLPGKGFDPFFTARGKVWSTPAERKAIIETYWAEIGNYPHWDQVLAALNLEPSAAKIDELLLKASGPGGGEGEDHKALKEYVCNHPESVDLLVHSGVGRTEFGVPSGDCIDVVFERNDRVVAVEVKPAGAPLHDLTRGLFQCVKYFSVLQAQAAFKSDRREISVFLVLGGKLPGTLVPLRNSLGVQVFEDVGPIPPS